MNIDQSRYEIYYKITVSTVFGCIYITFIIVILLKL
jgi:hypothetical protein